MFEKYWTDTKRWAAKPYNEDGDILDWFLFLGLLIIISIAWGTILRRLVL